MARFLECTDLVTRSAINVNFSIVESFEVVEQNGRTGSKINFISGRYIVVDQTPKQLSDIANAIPNLTPISHLAG